VSNQAGLAVVLRRVAQLLADDDVDTSWSSYEADELRDEVGGLLARAESGQPLSEPEWRLAQYLFLPTGPLQETAISSGWGDEFLELADRADEAI
jgi:hypothetical protein